MAFRCRICGNHVAARSYRFREMMFGTGKEFDYCECVACGCLQIRNIPADVGEYYPEHQYYSLSDPQANHRLGIRSLLGRIRNRYYLRHDVPLGAMLHIVRPNETLRLIGLTNIRPGSRILDVGCGNGEILRLLRIAGFENLLGVDPFLREDTRTPEGVILRKCTIHDVEGSWDVIMFNHSFEHLPDPAEQLSSVKRLLVPTGVCLLRIPTVSSFAWSHYGTHWIQLDPPRHLFLHSRRSIATACARAGLRCVRIIDDSNEFQFWGSEQVVRGIPLESRRSYLRTHSHALFDRREMSAFRKKAKELNREGWGDQIACYIAHGTPGSTGGDGSVWALR